MRFGGLPERLDRGLIGFSAGEKLAEESEQPHAGRACDPALGEAGQIGRRHVGVEVAGDERPPRSSPAPRPRRPDSQPRPPGQPPTLGG